MKNGNNQGKSGRMLPVFLILAALVILAVIAAMFVSGDTQSGKGKPGTRPTAHSQMATEDHHADQDATVDAADQSETAPDADSEQTEPGQAGTTEPTEAWTEDDDPEPTEEQSSVVIQQQKDAEYERWLAAAMLVCVSIDYPDFEPEAVYAASGTALSDKFSSDGAYIIFTSGGERLAIHSVALENERTEAGTTDISTEVIGFATFDRVDPANVDAASLDPIALEELSELISQSLLISIYKH